MSGAATGGRLSPAAAIGRDALRRVRIGRAALAGGLTLDDGAALGFNFTEKRTAPVLNVRRAELGERRVCR